MKPTYRCKLLGWVNPVPDQPHRLCAIIRRLDTHVNLGAPTDSMTQTSLVVRIDFQRMTIETTNSVYSFGQPRLRVSVKVQDLDAFKTKDNREFYLTSILWDDKRVSYRVSCIKDNEHIKHPLDFDDKMKAIEEFNRCKGDVP